MYKNDLLAWHLSITNVILTNMGLLKELQKESVLNVLMAFIHTFCISSVVFPFDVWYNDRQTTHTFGGTEIAPSFKGYIGDVTVYRRKVVTINEVPVMSLSQK